jgi:hypothetical protein
MTGQSMYSERWADEICERMIEGESLRSICRDVDTPSLSTVFKWLEEQPSFSEQYARAIELRAHVLADDAVEVTTTCADPQVARVRMDALKWRAGTLNPKVYGPRYQAEHTGPAGQPLLIVTGVPDVIPLIEGECVEVDASTEQVESAANTYTALANTLPAQSLPDQGGIPEIRRPRLSLVGEVPKPRTHSPHNSKARSRGRRPKAD